MGGRRRLTPQRSWVGPLAVVVIAVVLVVAVNRGIGTSAPINTPVEPVSVDASAWILPALNNKGVVRLADYRGTPVVVTFFASWCTACTGELPEFARVAQALKGRVAFVAVDSLETGDGLSMAKATGITDWTLARDVNGAADSGLHDALGGTGMPITAFYDKSGALVSVAQGALTPDGLRADLKRFYGVEVSSP